jgi:hypothetical protein
MNRLNPFYLITPFCFFIFLNKFSTHQTVKTKQVYYFVDTDCENCSVKNYSNSKIWIVTKGISESEWANHEQLIKKFQEEISQQAEADSLLMTRSVFRFQDSEDRIRKYYSDKENKMIRNGYRIIKIDFTE